MTWPWRIGVLLWAPGLVLLPSACSSDPTTPSPSPTPAATSAAPSATDAAASAAVAAWRGMWRDMAMAALTSDAQSPLLGRHATGDALENLTSSLTADRREGVVTRGELRLNPRVTKVSLAQQPPSVLISDCADSADWLKYRAGTTQLKNDVAGGRRDLGGTVVQVDGQWKVTDFSAQEVGSC